MTNEEIFAACSAAIEKCSKIAAQEASHTAVAKVIRHLQDLGLLNEDGTLRIRRPRGEIKLAKPLRFHVVTPDGCQVLVKFSRAEIDQNDDHEALLREKMVDVLETLDVLETAVVR